MTMGVEYELKFSCPEKTQQLLLQKLTGQRADYRMHTTYYDTPSRSLSARHFTLRCREENDVRVCTLKTPLPDGGRGEWEVVCDEIHSALSRLCALGAPESLLLLSREGLEAVCGARFSRTAVTVDFEGAALEVALDRGCLYGGGREQPLWEVEVELKEGSREAADRYAQLLAALYGLQKQPLSKFRRALMLAEGGSV